MWNKVKAKCLDFVYSKHVQKNLSMLLSIVLPISLLYLFYPDSFTTTWGAGRGMLLVFPWLLILEFALFWRRILGDIKSKIEGTTNRKENK